MVSYEKPYDGSPPQSDDGSHNEKALTRQEKEPSSREFDVYGDESHADIKYRTMDWWKAAALMLAETVSLGILSIPSVFVSLGMVGGCIAVVGLGAIATATGYVLGQFKLRHPHVHNMADAGEVLAGAFGRELLGGAQIVFLIFSAGSHALTGMIAFDTMLWAAITAIICMILTTTRTLNGISYLSVVSFISVFSAVLITMIGLGVAGHQGHVDVKVHTDFVTGFVAITDIIFAYSGHVTFFTFISEMKRPQDFHKALYALQIAATTLYLIVGVVVYAYTGENTVSPALGNTGPTLRRVAYGVALPTIIISGVVNGHVCAKLIFIRIFRRNGEHSKHMTTHSVIGWGTWITICVLIWTLGFIIACVIPFFNDLLGVVSAIFASWYTYGISGLFWFHLTRRSEWFSNTTQRFKAVFWAFIVFMGAFVMITGMYSNIQAIVDGYRSGGFPSPFSCINRGLV
ncbi:hypothetical protein EW026_g3291 [Hermanssonia centrifuga]|uniref:Amino acid transporter transmembrane domain-containing protein n=1 Tax=Hermanssonia centrifuga TaxID=98765 RepID=A0A4S4KKK5_9APHY|nr:hypothetical protein EW026_g3291 [Hermanssonia centrifuga]